MESVTLSEEQKRRIEENRAKALARRAEKNDRSITNNQNNLKSCPPLNKVAPPAQHKNSSVFSFYSGKQDVTADNENLNKKAGPSWVGVPVGHVKNSVTGSSSDSTKKDTESVQSKNVQSSFFKSSRTHSSVQPNNGLKQRTNVRPLSSTRPVGSSETSVHSTRFSAQIPVTKGSSISGSCVLVSREQFEVNVGFFTPLIEIFKQMKTKVYDPSSRKWSFKLEEYHKLLSAVEALKPHVSIEPLPKAVLQIFSSQLRGEYTDCHIAAADLSKVDQGLVDSLMPFQREGVDFAISKNGRILLADDMGLGKTIQAIAVADFYRSSWPLLVVCPSSVRFDWAQQIRRWLPKLDPQLINVVINGKASSTSGLVNITSYDLMARKAQELREKRFQIIIMDECHFLKNYKTVRTKSAMPILQNAKHVLLLSGTPALSRPLELFTQISAVTPFMFKFHDFGVRYCDGKQNPWGWDFTGSSNMKELQLLLEEKIMIRRQKKDVLKQLPAKVRQMVLLDPQSLVVHKNLKKASSVMNLKNLKGMERRGALLEYFHHTCTAKVKAVRDYILDLLEGDKKMLVFAHHQEMLAAVEEAISAFKGEVQYIRIDGRTSSEQRNIVCQKFQTNPDVKVAILSITAANAGINLSSASLVIFAELFWNPGILVQAEDRAHRLGQEDSVNVHYLVAQGTADDFIWPLVQTKLDVLSKAGLTKDNFYDADTTHQKDSKTQEIMQFFEQSFIEDSDHDEELDKDHTKIEHDEQKPTSTCDKNQNQSRKQVSIDKFFTTASKEDSSFECDNVLDEELLQLTEDVDWEDDFEPEAKKQKL
ncbi:SWI/SNF-related matrix-associated actin-dependent regulator of chromatin subfamily A-like protein 1 [Gigantopelta aegis]|uniref:SWI/SNF-related matrix-associated actin-dependent regulator of chromatin subfamily A-like protein 1 n=1 Tax=Gigantopelta aegis TaxID=1735272 RepID=UPI001B88E3A9|nr:SWI/SNF-related matrix-associated actin-dependent regulator of chromatin subfamily A-like protein 1 [Gigantopelta aegis]